MGLELPPKLTLNQFLVRNIILQLRSHRTSVIPHQAPDKLSAAFGLRLCFYR